MKRRKKTFNLLFNSLRLGVNFVAILAAIATFIGFLAEQWWIFQLLDHLRVQLSLILLLAILLNGIKYRFWSLAFCLPFFLNVLLILPLFIPPSQNINAVQGNNTAQNSLQLLHLNLDRNNTNYTPTLQYLDQQNADLIFLQEVTPAWLNQIESNLTGYRVVESRPLKNSHGVAFLVPKNLPPSLQIKNTEILHFPLNSERPMIAAEIEWNQPLSILSLHVTRPRNNGTTNYQKKELDGVAAWSQEQQNQGHQVIIIGDFNLTPWSIRFRQFLQAANLRNSQRGFGLQPTWLAGLPPFMMIAIDHGIYSEDLVTLDRKIGPKLGSDHLPLGLEVTERL
ncbi:endonuclease/exonuclease/phosphatase family protein [Capilliphycus salinus ALCB114379]|uniref:endonuclease/exonuclease/phosphatase family protein n=1 Tax=Capilliphycus salinus TaxID=2768948 RepID=UPI0039A56E26